MALKPITSRSDTSEMVKEEAPDAPPLTEILVQQRTDQFP